MELIQIIYNILLFGGGFVLVIMVVSFMLSKSRQNELRSSHQEDRNIISEQLVRARVNYQNQVASILPKNQLQWEQSELRQNVTLIKPKIFPIDQIQSREVKVVRKSTVREEQKTRSTEEKLNNGKRYTIVNDNQRKSNSRVINFYL